MSKSDRKKSGPRRPQCLGCDRSADMLGLFTPHQDHQMEFGATFGKTRVIQYPVCHRCVADPNKPAVIEERLLEKLRKVFVSANRLPI